MGLGLKLFEYPLLFSFHTTLFQCPWPLKQEQLTFDKVTRNRYNSQVIRAYSGSRQSHWKSCGVQKFNGSLYFICICKYKYIYTIFQSFHHVFTVWYGCSQPNLLSSCMFFPFLTSHLGLFSKARREKNTNVAFTKQHQRFHNTNGCRISTRCPTQHQRFRRSRGIDREASRPSTRNDQEPNLEESCWVGLAVKKLVCWKNDHQMFRGLVFRVEGWLKLVCWKSMDV